MLEVVVEVDGRPLSRWGCDGVVWRRRPARPRTRSPPAGRSSGRRSRRCCSCRSARTRCSPGRWSSSPRLGAGRRGRCTTGAGAGVLWCDGRRDGRPAARRPGRGPPGRAAGAAGPAALGAVHRPAGGEVRPAGARLARPGRARTVPTHPPRRLARVLEEMRIRGLGVIDDAVLELAPGLTVVTGETGAGKTMVVTGLGLLFGGRADPGAVRPGAAERVGRGPAAGRARRCRGRPGRPTPAPSSTTTCCWSPARCPPRAGPGPTSAAGRCRRRARRAGRDLRGRARPDRPAAAAATGPPARGARPVRRRGGRRPARAPTGGVRRAASGRAPSSPS